MADSNKYILKFFMTVKWWQMLLFFGIIGYAVISIKDNDKILILGIIKGVMDLIFFLWIALIGNNLNIKLQVFRRIYLVFFNIFISIVASFYLLMNLDAHAFDDVLSVLLPFVFAGIFYTAYFISKSLRTIELVRQVVFADYFGCFILLVFFPFGIWFIQPRINKIFKAESI